jgi:hypothetical protein
VKLVSTALRALSARFEPTALACQHFSFSLSCLAVQRMRNRCLRRSGSTLVGRLPHDLAEMLRSHRAQRGGGLTSAGEAGAC